MYSIAMFKKINVKDLQCWHLHEYISYQICSMAQICWWHFHPIQNYFIHHGRKICVMVCYKYLPIPVNWKASKSFFRKSAHFHLIYNYKQLIVEKCLLYYSYYFHYNNSFICKKISLSMTEFLSRNFFFIVIEKLVSVTFQMCQPAVMSWNNVTFLWSIVCRSRFIFIFSFVFSFCE